MEVFVIRDDGWVGGLYERCKKFGGLYVGVCWRGSWGKEVNDEAPPSGVTVDRAMRLTK